MFDASKYTFNGEEIKTENELKRFVKKVKFPSHGLIIKKNKDDFSEIIKGITTFEQLNKTFNNFISIHGKAFIETDMRAMYNPSRMKVIKKATTKLADKINSYCPQCQTPGFGITDRKEGLRCMQCNFPTRSTFCYVYTCQKCAYTKELMYPNKKTTEDPMYCDVCNP